MPSRAATSIVWPVRDFIGQVTDRLADNFDPSMVGERLAEFLIGLVAALLTFAAFYLLWRILRWALTPALRRAGVDLTAQSFTLTLVMYAVFAVGVVAALGELGVNPASLVTSLGVLGLTIGFAARDALANIISGIFIFWDRPFVIGDLIEVGGHYGRVDRVTMRSTRVITADGKMLAIPNADVLNQTVASYTNFPHLRLDVRIDIDASEDVERVRKMLLALVRDDAAFLEKPAPRVLVMDVDGTTVRTELQVWLDDERQHIPERARLSERAFAAAKANRVKLAVQTIELRRP